MHRAHACFLFASSAVVLTQRAGKSGVVGHEKHQTITPTTNTAAATLIITSTAKALTVASAS